MIQASTFTSRMDVLLDDDLSLDFFSQWSVVGLQDFNQLRGFPKNGTKSELAAMAYTAYTMEQPLIKSAQEKINEAKADYSYKLVLPDGTRISDPLKITDGWKGEATSIPTWPTIIHGDIVQYFNQKQGIDPKMVLNKYKEGKAYSFFFQLVLLRKFYLERCPTHCAS